MMAKPVYLVVDVKIDDLEAYGKYKEKVKPLIESYGGEYLSRGGEINVLENALWESTRMVLVKFPDKESAMDSYNYEEYSALKKIRIDNATLTSFYRGSLTPNFIQLLSVFKNCTWATADLERVNRGKKQ